MKDDNWAFYPYIQQKQEETEKTKKKKGQKKSNTQKMGGLENGQEVVPPFFFQKNGFSEILKKPIFIAFPEEWVATIFFQKGYVKEDRLRGRTKMITFWCLLRQKCLRRCQSKKKGGVEGRSPPPQKGREKHSHGRVLVVFVVVGCCF